MGPATPVASLSEPEAPAAITTWFNERWGGRAASTYNRNLDALRSAVGYWREQDCLSGDPTPRLPPRTKGWTLRQVRHSA